MTGSREANTEDVMANKSRCERCNKRLTTPYYSDDRCNRFGGIGLVLCEPCATILSEFTDEAFERGEWQFSHTKTVEPATKIHEGKLTFEVEIDRDTLHQFTRDVVLNSDLFNRGYCGYWLYGVEFLTVDGESYTIAYEQADDDRPSESAQEEAVTCFEDKRPLPKGFHVLSKETAKKAYIEGVKRWGIDWYANNGDGNGYDYVVQMALLGEVRYG